MDEKGPEEAGLPQSEQGPQGGRASAFTLYHISRPRSGVTGDALYCQRTFCQQIRRASGHYFFVIKANQPELLEEVGLLFAVPPPGDQFATAASRRRRRDRYEERILTVSTALAAYVRELGWVGAQQVLRLESSVRQKGKTTQMVRYFVTSLGPHVSPATLLRPVREHWHIENRRHDVRDVTLGEDASQVRSGSAPQVLAALRNALLGLLRQHGWGNIAEALQHFAWLPALLCSASSWDPSHTMRRSCGKMRYT